jgi:hypothetical protein
LGTTNIAQNTRKIKVLALLKILMHGENCSNCRACGTCFDRRWA